MIVKLFCLCNVQYIINTFIYYYYYYFVSIRRNLCLKLIIVTAHAGG